ncbi:MAG: hypothetical protein CVU91_09035 [Firmicutes bacterium HGW-Firmicutes-16]|nr:MAG: hypothetical protein CVU91_09035 [Firmicutes bacterium HGW-Firmicutes-16]
MNLKKLFSLAVAIISVFCLFSGAYASNWEDFTDISGHWAEKTIKKGFEDGLITGLDGTSVAPDAPITAAQIITVLCRILGATEKADTSSLGISSDVWYFDAAGKALNLGLISAETGNLDAPMTRQAALSMMAKAFSLVPAEPDYTVLTPFSDASKIFKENRGAIAALVSKNLIQGFDGALNVDGSITRAEFLTILYRVADNYTSAGALTSSTSGGSIVKGSGSLNYISIGNLWFDCSARSVSLIGVKADTVTLRNNELTSFYLSGGSDISSLVVAVGKGSSSLGGDLGSKVGVLRLESCNGMSVGSGIDKIELTGNNMSVSISGEHNSLVITGSGNTVTLSSGASISVMKVAGMKNTIKTADGAVYLGKTEVSGNENDIEAVISTGCSLSVGGTLNKISLKSDENLEAIDVAGNSNWLSISCKDLSTVSISGSYNTVNKLSTGVVTSVDVPGSDNAFVLYKDNVMTRAELNGQNNIMTVNGTSDTITLSGRKNTLDGTGNVAYLNVNASGCTISLIAECVTDNSGQAEIDRVQELVTLGYTGNYTLKWAQEHDYEESEKETWVNAKDYSSSTDYIIWINLSMQRVNIFKGSTGNWDLIYSCIVGTGAPGRGTPIGEWKTTYKAWNGWTTSTYTVKPVVGFKDNTGYAFHSRLYYPGTTTLSDSSIGYPVSHGCVRMYDADILYIYNNIPLRTTVVVY